MAAPPAKRGGALAESPAEIRPHWVRQAVHTTGMVYSRAKRKDERDRLARAAWRAREYWAELQKRVFGPLLLASERAELQGKRERNRSEIPETLCWLVLESTLLWYVELATDPVETRHAIEKDLHEADVAVLSAAHVFCDALAAYGRARDAAWGSFPLGTVPDGSWDDDLVTALRIAADRFHVWASLAGEEDGLSADANLTHRADPISTRGWMPTA